MAQTAHTPGPWNLSTTDPTIVWCTKNGQEPGICDTSSPTITPVSYGEAIANAALISAAPDMLEALQHIASLPIWEITSEDIGKCRDAIVKATTFELSK